MLNQGALVPRSSSIRGLTATVAVLVAAVLAPAAQAASSPTAFMSGTRIGTIAPTGSLNLGRAGATVTLLGDGKVLVAGGYPGMEPTASAEIYDPSTGLFTATGAMNEPRAEATATLLGNGKVLIAGGAGQTGTLDSAELYDPASGTFTPTASMHAARWGATATLLSDGRQVLIAGGSRNTDTGTERLKSAELYRVQNNSAPDEFQVVGDLGTARYSSPTATLLENGKVLIAGGGETGTLDSAELYNPSTRSFRPTGSMTDSRDGATATMLGSGKVLIAGGCRTGPCEEFLARAELYDPASGTFRATGSMTDKRMSASATLLANGQVLVAGGVDAEGTLERFDVYDPVSGTFKFGGLLGNYRLGGAGLRLVNGKVLLVGGGDQTGPTTSAELYTPAARAGPPVNSFAPVGALRQPGFGAASALLENGKVLIVGGAHATATGFESSDSAELYDPANWYQSACCMRVPRSGPTATLLPNGKVLIAGGIKYGEERVNLASAEIFNPATGSFTLTGSMHTGQQSHTATLLPNGKVLIAGPGSGPGGGGIVPAEIYDPSKGTFAETRTMIKGRFDATATLLPNGKVLIAGGFDGITFTPTASAELFDPATGRFTKTGDMHAARVGNTATLLPSGKVLIASGDDEDSATGDTSAELYDPSTGKFALTGSLTSGRWGATATLLKSGKVLFSGGGSPRSYGVLSSAELYDPASGKFTGTGGLGAPRAGASATLLANGKVFVAGGNTSWASDDLYSPAPVLAPAKPVVKWAVNKAKRLVTATVNPVSGVIYKLTAKLGRKTKTGSCKRKGSKLLCTISPGRGKWAFAVTPSSAGGKGPANRKTLKL
jgi:hypothetical protein